MPAFIEHREWPTVNAFVFNFSELTRKLFSFSQIQNGKVFGRNFQTSKRIVQKPRKQIKSGGIQSSCLTSTQSVGRMAGL